MASKAATLLMIVETMLLPTSRDATCLTKRFLYLNFKFWIIPPSAGFSFKVILFGKNNKLMKLIGALEGSLDDMVGCQDTKGQDGFLVSSVHQLDQRSFALTHLPSMTLYWQSNVIQPVDSIQLVSENNVEFCSVKLQLGYMASNHLQKHMLFILLLVFFHLLSISFSQPILYLPNFQKRPNWTMLHWLNGSFGYYCKACFLDYFGKSEILFHISITRVSDRSSSFMNAL